MLIPIFVFTLWVSGMLLGGLLHYALDISPTGMMFVGSGWTFFCVVVRDYMNG